MEKTNQPKKNKNLDWKQWIPIYGVYQIIKDVLGDKPTFFDCVDPYTFSGATRMVGVSTYHGLVTTIPILKGLEALFN